jgi:putative GTP pyrophosphokinase
LDQFSGGTSEANHDLSYKSEQLLERHQLRKVAFTAAQSWGADQIFHELAKELIDGYAA